MKPHSPDPTPASPPQQTLHCLARVSTTLNALLRQLDLVFHDLDDARIFSEILEANLRGPLDGERLLETQLKPCNAFSVAQASGIPRETVRRRVNRLIEDGWLMPHRNGGLVCTSAAIHGLAARHAGLLAQHLDCQDETRSPASCCRNCASKRSAVTAGDHK
ncbi:winged helix-turn-helix domain-containing protein [Paludibacterium paludis]|uniref:Uncharacterized protein n=1 Tax=Paludibacterium paludis TaxID=1225769 RepID=A0A918U9P8_9NEIS|nr:winged helix-turn-helix domain-containing protein [Paludibacterium paludis]GGY13673.1 hypothetical protein GCM10011289_16250 [Paludibacterium paludis]